MSKIDQAFVKAFAKKRSPAIASAAEDSPFGVDRLDTLAALGTSLFWIDPSNNDLFRVDEPQTVEPQPAKRSRGSRPHLPPSSPFENGASAPESARLESARFDTGASQWVSTREAAPLHEIQRLRIDPQHGSAPPAHYFRTRLNASSFPTIDVTHDSIDDVSDQLAATAAPVEPPEQVKAPEQVKTSEQVKAPEQVKTSEPISAPAVSNADVAVSATSPAVDDTAPALTASSIVKPAATQTPFEAAWEVDQFEPPFIVEELMTHGGLISAAGIPLATAARDGMQTVLITSPKSGAGRSTIAIGLALSAASTGLRVALIDGDFESPSLVDDLQLDLEFGWPEAIRGGVPLSETAVSSEGDGVTLFPIVPASTGLAPQAAELRQAVLKLRDHFDLIIVDGSAVKEKLPSDTFSSDAFPSDTFQSAIVIRDARNLDRDGVEHCVASLQAAGIEQIGIAENFAD